MVTLYLYLSITFEILPAIPGKVARLEFWPTSVIHPESSRGSLQAAPVGQGEKAI